MASTTNETSEILMQHPSEPATAVEGSNGRFRDDRISNTEDVALRKAEATATFGTSPARVGQTSTNYSFFKHIQRQIVDIF